MHRAAWLVVSLAVVLASGTTQGAAFATAASGPYRNGLVAFVRCCGLPETGIYLIRPNGTGERRIFTSAADDAPLDPSWSPDGRLIAYAPGNPHRGVWVMRANGAGRRRVTRGTGGSLFPSWSPDARWIVFSDIRGAGSARHDLFRVRVDGTGLKRLTTTPADELMPAWAPNGGEIAYVRGRDLWQMKPDGSAQRLLVRDATAPSWSPGGTHLAFVRDGDPWVIARDGTGARRIVHMPRQQAAVAWSPDGRLLVTASFERGNLTLVSADGSQTTPLTNAPVYSNSWPSWQRLPR